MERTQRADGRWDVSQFRCSEISLVRDPVNINCVVRERMATYPLLDLAKARTREIDLTNRRVQCVRKMIELLQQELGRAAA
jgi:hypothetical protein